MGGRRPADLGFRDKRDFQRLIERHMMETNYVPQVGYQPQVDNTLMPKFSRWKETLKYGKIMPISVAREGFADPEFQGCGAKDGEFALGYDHEEMRKFTRRWNRVLRHEVGRGGAPYCDELGWVAVDTFLGNDFSWPRDYPPARSRNNFTDPDVIAFRRGRLMEGYRPSMSSKSRKKRMLMVAIYITPDELEEMWKYEDRNIYTEAVVRQNRGWIRLIALRATSGHSFQGGGDKRPLMVNIDYRNMNMPFTKELATRLGGGYHVSSIRNLLSIVKTGLMPGGNVGNRDHVFLGEYAPWDPINTCTLSYIAGEDRIWVLYIPGARLLKYRPGFIYNGDVIVGETIPFSEVQEAWIARKSAVATGPRRIMSSKVVDKVVCQCDHADRAVPPQIIKGKLDKMVQRARDLGKEETIDELNLPQDSAQTA